MVRNDGTPDEKKFLDITPRKIRVPDDRYISYFDQRIQVKDVPPYHQKYLFDHYNPRTWTEQWQNVRNIN